MPWRSAEAVLFNLDEDAPSAYRFWITAPNLGGRRVTREGSESRSMHRAGAAAFYREDAWKSSRSRSSMRVSLREEAQ